MLGDPSAASCEGDVCAVPQVAAAPDEPATARDESDDTASPAAAAPPR